MCNIRAEDFREVITNEHTYLCNLVNIDANLTEILIPELAHSDGFVAPSNRVYIPICGHNLRDNRDITLPPNAFPPEYFKRIGEADEWPNWRKGVWHEFIHEIQYRILNEPGPIMPEASDPTNHSWIEACGILRDRLIASEVNNVPSLENFSRYVCDAR
ncbi:MAG: hypothetical protein K1X86_08155 [Ignavibacteria bacterium]|nr:hypothetical protein [Ignavibacteria bacterium]